MLRHLSLQTLDWLSKVVPDAKLSCIQPLAGSTSASVYRLEFTGAPSAVLRQFDRLPEWLIAEPDLALHEARSLTRAEQISLPTPKLLAFDERGEQSGVPGVLMSHLPGKGELNPPNLTGELDQLARALTEIHRVSPTGFGWTYAPYTDLNTLTVPTWTTAPQAWARAIQLLQEPPPAFTPSFIHRDFHPANVLWQDEQISGVVDWVNACVGPIGADLGHCRVNLAQMYGIEAADAFKAAYERRTGHLQNPYWDLLSLADLLDGDRPPEVYSGWPAFELTQLTDELIRARLDAFLLSLAV